VVVLRCTLSQFFNVKSTLFVLFVEFADCSPCIMASEAKTEDDSKAKTANDTPGVVTFNVPQEAEVALSGGEILLDLPGENDFRLKVSCL